MVPIRTGVLLVTCRQEPSRRPEERRGVGGWTTFRHPLNAGEAVRLAGEEALKRILPGGSHSTRGPGTPPPPERIRAGGLPHSTGRALEAHPCFPHRDQVHA